MQTTVRSWPPVSPRVSDKGRAQRHTDWSSAFGAGPTGDVASPLASWRQLDQTGRMNTASVHAGSRRPYVRLLGGFSVELGDRTVTAGDFERPLAAQLVKLLALRGGRLHREQVIDALWPDRDVEQAAPQLHKMATYARKALEDKASIVFRDETVLLWPEREHDVDVRELEDAAAGDDGHISDLYSGELLPEDLYEDWVGPERDRLRNLFIDALRRTARWDQVLAIEPADERAHVAIMQDLIARGHRLAALRQYERLESALQRELGVSPSAESRALRAAVVGEVDSQIELRGREEERFALRRALDDAAVEAGGPVLLTGPAGIGKSALAEWFSDRAHSRGFAVGRGASASVDDPRPYAPVLEAFEDVFRAQPDLLQQLPETHRDELVRVRDVAEGDHKLPATGDGHERLFVALEAAAQLACNTSGLLLTIEDVHLADQASVDLLQYLARRARRQRFLIVLTARTAADAKRLDAVREMVVDAGGWELRVGPLGDTEAAAFVQSFGLTSDAAERVVALAGGTPFHLEQLARTSASGGDLPSRVADLARLALGGVSEPVRAALRRLAVVGLRFDTDQFVALAAVDEDTAFDALNRALAADVIAHSGGGYRFRHALVRESLLDELAPHQRRRIHLDAARQFEAGNAPPARIARHLVEAGDQAGASPWSLAAAQAAIAVGAMSDAAATVDRVIDHAEGDVRFGLLLARADALAGMSDGSAFGAYQRALAEAPEEMTGFIRAKMAMAVLMQGDAATASEVLAGVEPNGGPYDGPILQAHGVLAYLNRDLDAAEDRVAAARQIALADRSNGRLLDVLTLQGLVAHDRGEWFDRMSFELTNVADSSELATTVFDCHL